MPRRLLLLVVVCLTGLTLVAAGCGGGGDESAADETVATLTETTEETTTEEATEETTTEEAEATEEEATEEEPTEIPDFASSENCQEFAQIGAQIAEAVSGTSDLDQIKEAFGQYAAAAPDDIKADFETLAEYIAAVADAVGDISPGETPSAEALSKLQALDATEATQASQNIANWVTENCT